MELVLGGYVVKLYHFADETDMPWFQAKPIAVHLEYVQVNHAFSHVDSDDKLSLKELIDKKGCPIGGSPESGLLGYNDGKAIYVNESGLYCMIFGSKKPEARAFKRWVTHEVLPSIRCKGFYGDVQSAKASVALLTSTVGNLVVALKERDESWKISVHDQCREQLEVARSSFLEAMSTKLTAVSLRVMPS
jgi:prophage antirepressor-like protein